MAEHYSGKGINPEIAGHLLAAMEQVPGPQPLQHFLPHAAGDQRWPDGNGKHRHLKERDTRAGRAGHEAAVNAVHRTGRPELPHSS